RTGSTVAALSGAEPFLFGETQLITFTTPPKAEYVAEGANKAPSDVAFSSKTVTPHKVQVTTRFNEEVQWADEDYQSGVLSTISDALSVSLASALDLGMYHAVNPLCCGSVGSITEEIADTTHNVSESVDPDIDIGNAVGEII